MAILHCTVQISRHNQHNGLSYFYLVFATAMLWIRIRMDPHQLKGSIRICIEVISCILIRIHIKVMSRIRIRISLQMARQNVWNRSLFEHFSKFCASIWKLESGSASKWWGSATLYVRVETGSYMVLSSRGSGFWIPSFWIHSTHWLIVICSVADPDPGSGI